MHHLLFYAEQPLIRHAIGALLDQDGKLSLTTTDCIETFTNHLAATHYHAILFATDSGGANSIEEICTTLEQIQPATKLILLLDQDDPCCMDQLLSLNVAGCLTKDRIDQSLPHIVHAVVAGKSIFTRGVVEKLLAEPTAHANFEHAPFDLTDSERAVANLMLQGLTNPQIATELCLAHQTVRNTVSHIYEKLGVHSRVEFMHWQFPEINDGGWIMMAHSVTDPQLGDCHNGETNPAYLRVLRIGYLMGNFPGWSSTDRAGMTAWITYDNNVIVTPFSMNPSLWSTQVVQVALNRDPDTVNNANKWRFFLRTRYRWGNWTPWALVGSALDGPGVDLKCVTSGGWASSTSNHEGGSGKVEMENIHYLDRHISSNWIDVPYYNSPTWWEQHAVEVNSPYFLPVSYSVIIDSDSDLEIDTND